MKLVNVDLIIAQGSFAASTAWVSAREDIESAIKAVVWPPGSTSFTLKPGTGRGRGEGNGVVPIKHAFLECLQNSGWSTDERGNPHRFDAFKRLRTGNNIGLEWETGNISSSHRSVNRILLGHLEGTLIAGVLVLPTRALYRYLTDRVGNYEELRPYFPVWQQYPWTDGVLAVLAVEHDATDESVPRIQKGTNGRAQF